jgi:hypothetical protein
MPLFSRHIITKDSNVVSNASCHKLQYNFGDSGESRIVEGLQEFLLKLEFNVWHV